MVNSETNLSSSLTKSSSRVLFESISVEMSVINCHPVSLIGKCSTWFQWSVKVWGSSSYKYICTRDVLWITRVMRSKEHVRPRPRPLSKTIIQATQRSEMETGGNMRGGSQSVIMGSPESWHMRWSCELINSIYTNNSGHGTWGTRGINESILKWELYFHSLLLSVEDKESGLLEFSNEKSFQRTEDCF